MTVQDAARLLGVSEGAVRKRVARGTLKNEKEPDGRVYVYLDERDTRGVDVGRYGGVDVGVSHEPDALISQLRDEIAYLREESRRKDEIIMQQAISVRQLLPAPEPDQDETPETHEEPSEPSEPWPEVSTPPEPTGGPETSAQRRPWWLRWLGG